MTNQLLQSIHNLRVRWPIGIKSIDDAHDEKLKRLEALLARLPYIAQDFVDLRASYRKDQRITND